MRVDDFIEKLKEYPPNAELGICNPDTFFWVSDITFSHDVSRNEVSVTPGYVDLGATTYRVD